MNDTHLIQVEDVYAVEFAAAAKVREQIAECLKAGTPVTVDFSSVEIVSPSYLATAIASLLDDFTPGQLNELLTIDGIGMNAFTLRRVISAYQAMLKVRDEQA